MNTNIIFGPHTQKVSYYAMAKVLNELLYLQLVVIFTMQMSS